MTFQQTLLYKVINQPSVFAHNNCFYSFVLAIPCIVVYLSIGIPVTVVCDLCVATLEVFGSE